MKSTAHIVYENRMKKLRIFDFDDTLALTDSAIRVLRGDVVVRARLSSIEFKTYKLQAGERFDMSAFDKVINPKVIKPTMKVLRRILSKPSPAVILTGRGAADPVREWLHSVGIRPNGIVALGRSVANAAQLAQAKAKWIETQIETEGWTVIEVFEDSKENLTAMERLKAKFPNVKFILRYVGHYAEKMHEHLEYERSVLSLGAWDLIETADSIAGYYALVGVEDNGAVHIVLSRSSDAIGIEHSRFRDNRYRTIARTPKLPKQLNGQPMTQDAFVEYTRKRYNAKRMSPVRYI